MLRNRSRVYQTRFIKHYTHEPADETKKRNEKNILGESRGRRTTCCDSKADSETKPESSLDD